MKPITVNKPLLLRGALLCAPLCLAWPAFGADVLISPMIAVSEEYNDNVLDAAADRRSDFITRLQPGIVLGYGTPSLRGDLRYNFDYHDYARDIKEDEETHYLAFNGRAELVDNFFFLELSDTFSRVSLDVARDVTTESLFANQTDQNLARVSPYLLWRPGGKSLLKTGYRFVDTSYWDSPGIDKRENWGFSELKVDPVARLSLTAGYAYGRIRTPLIDYDQHDLNAGVRYEYAENSFIYGGIGNSWQLVDDRNVSNLFWHAGVSRDFRFGLATLEARVRYTEAPLAISTKETSYRAVLQKALPHSTYEVSTSYSKYQETFSGAGDHRKAALGGLAGYELSPRLKLSLSLMGDKISRRTSEDYAYHMSGSGAVSYSLLYDINASLSYSYIDYRRQLRSADEARQTNRVILSLNKRF